MKGQVRAFWLNALIITTVMFMWLSVIGGVATGIIVANAAASSTSSSNNEPTGDTASCHWDFDNESWRDADGEACRPSIYLVKFVVFSKVTRNTMHRCGQYIIA